MKILKRLLSAGLALAMTLTLAACGTTPTRYRETGGR